MNFSCVLFTWIFIRFMWMISGGGIWRATSKASIFHRSKKRALPSKERKSEVTKWPSVMIQCVELVWNCVGVWKNACDIPLIWPMSKKRLTHIFLNSNWSSLSRMYSIEARKTGVCWTAHVSFFGVCLHENKTKNRLIHCIQLNHMHCCETRCFFFAPFSSSSVFQKSHTYRQMATGLHGVQRWSPCIHAYCYL